MTPSTDEPAGPFGALRRDHEKVLAILEALERTYGLAPADPVPERASIRARLGEFTRALEPHLATEDRALFPLLAARVPEIRAALAPLAEDHAEIRDLCASLDASLGDPGRDVRDEQTRVQFRDLAELLRHHQQREEQTVFGVVERLLGEDGLLEITRSLAGHGMAGSPGSNPDPYRAERARHSNERTP